MTYLAIASIYNFALETHSQEPTIGTCSKGDALPGQQELNNACFLRAIKEIIFPKNSCYNSKFSYSQ
jgi:hypothetical protein